MKIGIRNDYYCNKYGFEKGLERLKNHGYEGIDYGGFENTETELFKMNAQEFEECIKKQSNEIEKQGLTVYQAHGPWRWPPRDFMPEDRAERFEKMKRSIEGTAILGCKNIVIHPLMPYTWEDEGHEKETWEINLEFMGRLCQVARENDVVICFENMPMPNFSLASVSQILKFVKMIDDDYFKVCLDTGHAQVCGLSPYEAVRLIGKDYLRALHVHDNDGVRDYHWHPFNGVIDWPEFGKTLDEIDFEGFLSLETSIKELPDELCEYEEIGLYRKAEFISRCAKRK